MKKGAYWMKVHVENVFKNMRYKLFSIDGVYYILEIRPSFWKSLFPFLYWFFPFPVYKVEDEETVERIKTPESWSMNKSSVAISAGGFAVLGAYYLRYLTESATFQFPVYLKFVIITLAMLSVIVLRLYVNRIKRKSLSNKVNLNQLRKREVNVKPQSFKQVIQMIISYVFFLFFVVIFYYSYIIDNNLLILLVASASLFVLTIISNISVKEGWTTIKFINK